MSDRLASALAIGYEFWQFWQNRDSLDLVSISVAENRESRAGQIPYT